MKLEVVKSCGATRAEKWHRKDQDEKVFMED